MNSFLSNDDYRSFLVDVKSKIQKAQVEAAVKVNQQLLLLYREIGKMIVHRQQESDW